MPPRRAYRSVPRHALRTGQGHTTHHAGRRSLPASSGRRAAASSLALRAALRVLAVAVLSVVAGGMVYVVLPVPSAAAPGLPSTPLVAAPSIAMPVGTPGLQGGLIRGDDLLDDPSGVTSTSPDATVGGLIGWPVSDHTPSSGFGYRTDPFTHRQRWHDGVDLGQPCGDTVQAALAGTVAAAGWAGGYGNRVILRHADRGGHTFSTTYNHLSRIDVTAGQAVQQGQALGRVGSTGRSTACHLHFEVILDGAYVDPMRFLTGDQSKAGLSRRVGSPMPSGLPSPDTAEPTTAWPTIDPTPTPTRRATPTPTPTTVSPTPTSPSPSPLTPTPSPTSPLPTSPDPTPTPSPTDTSPTPSPSPAAMVASDLVTASGTGTPGPAPTP